MPSRGGYAAAPPPPRQGGDRFYNPPAVRRQQILLQQQQQMMQMQLHQQHQHQQQQQQQQHQEQQLQQQRQMQRALKAKAKVKAEASSSSSAAAAAEASGGGESSAAAALAVPRSISPAAASKVTNLDRLMESVTPFIEARFSSEKRARGLRTTEVDSHTFFYLEDLWECFGEWSVYGRGVPLLLYETEPIQQYYVPFLSGIQLYVDPSKVSNRTSSNSKGDKAGKYVFDLNLQQLSRFPTGDGASSKAGSPGSPLFQFLEHEQPYNRRPLSDKISLLAAQFPELDKIRSCDLLPSSWICVAWYPIYRIPVGPTLQDLDASFLTFHSLSTQSRSNSPPPQFHQANTRTVRGFVDPTARISLPVFGLASYKLKGSILSPCGPQELEQENSLLQAADDWLRCLHVVLPDYQFFRNHSQWR